MRNYLEYVGSCHFIIIDLYSSRVRVRISKDSPYFFNSSDILNKEAIKYYKSLRREGLVLHLDAQGSTNLSEDKKINLDQSTNSDEVKDENDGLQNTHDNDEVSTGSDHSTDKSDDPTDSGHEDIKLENNDESGTETNEDEYNKNEDPDSSENNENENNSTDSENLDQRDLGATSEEMMEFIDLNYSSDSDLKSLAKEVGMKRVSTSDREKLISKIISTNPGYIINLMKSQ